MVENAVALMLLNSSVEKNLHSPIGNVLASLAACSSIHLMSVLKEKGYQISSYSVEVKADRDKNPPRALTDIHLNYVIKSKGLTDSILKAIIVDTEGNQCSISVMLRKACLLLLLSGY